MAMMPPKTAAQTQSDPALANSKLSSQRREKLMHLKKREELKDALTQRFKERFGTGSQERGFDEVSVATSAIRREVDNFADRAAMTEANLNRLERRLQKQARTKDPETASQAAVSEYSFAGSRSRSLASIAGESMVKGPNNTYDWARLDEYASYLHEQDALRQKQGVLALQRKLRTDLDNQVSEKRMKSDIQGDEDRRYHKNLMLELDNWNKREQARIEERRRKLQKEKRDRDEQLEYERKLKGEASQKKKEEESALVTKIVNEMESEQKKFERKRREQKEQMKKIFDDNNEDQKRRNQIRHEQQEKDAEAMREYNRLLDEQDEARAEEMRNRMDRQKMLMAKMQENVAQIAKESGDNDAQRAAKQQEEMDRHAYEAEKCKQDRLKQMKLETQAYLVKQMGERDWRKAEERELQQIQAEMLARDSEEYYEMERRKAFNKKQQQLEHRQEIEKQIHYRAGQKAVVMSEDEIKLNKGLLKLVESTLTHRDKQLSRAQESDEEYEQA
mmetsp:Transcript_46386/g.110479  ORF Transcript_46386/g.110479 Transcript_46386/m.110479 type:complete len:504 (-) Transcript_46386:222-1733(-)